MEQYGIYLGEVFTQNPFNKKGNRESAVIQSINNDLLALNGGSWDKPILVETWGDEQRQRRDEIILSLQGHSWWGFKDPRTVFTLPFWLEVLPDVQFIATFRHPHRVAKSLAHRDKTSIESAYQLWLAYNRQLLKWIHLFDVPMVNFDLADDAYLVDVDQKLRAYGLEPPATPDFFDKSLRHQTEDSEPIGSVVLPVEVQRIYQELLERHGSL